MLDWPKGSVDLLGTIGIENFQAGMTAVDQQLSFAANDFHARIDHGRSRFWQTPNRFDDANRIGVGTVTAKFENCPAQVRLMKIVDAYILSVNAVRRTTEHPHHQVSIMDTVSHQW